MASEQSPYPLGALVRDPGLLQNRRAEIDSALEKIAPEGESEHGHVVVLGEARSGRSSVLVEVARRVSAERGRLVVWLRAEEEVQALQPRPPSADVDRRGAGGRHGRSPRPSVVSRHATVGLASAVVPSGKR